MRQLLIAATVVCLAALRTAADDAREWQVRTLFSDKEVVANGGIAIDVHTPTTVYASSRTQRAVWRVDTTKGSAAVLAGQLDGPAAIVDGRRISASFNQPRGVCQSPKTGDIFVLDGVAHTAVLRKVELGTGTVTTILGDPSASKPADGFGRAGVLTSGSWWLSCQPDGTVLLADTQTRSWRRICPPGWPEAECASVAPAPAPGPPPGSHGSGVVARWWEVAVAGLLGLALGGAACGGAGHFVASKITSLRTKHSAKAPVGGAGGWGEGQRDGASYEALPAFHDSNGAHPTVDASGQHPRTSKQTAPIRPAAAKAGVTSFNRGNTQTLPTAANLQSPWNLGTTGDSSYGWPGDRFAGAIKQGIAAAPAAAPAAPAGPGRPGNVPDSQAGSHAMTVETFRRGSGNLSNAAAAGDVASIASEPSWTESYADISEMPSYTALPTVDTASLARGGSQGSSNGRVPNTWHSEQQQQRQPLYPGPGSVSWPVGTADGVSSTGSVDMMSRSSPGGSETRSLLRGA